MNITDAMPSYLEGVLGGIGIFGAKREGPGMRHVGVGYPESKALYAKIKQERVQILDGLGARVLISLGYTPFISLFKTPSQDIARDVAQELRKTGICGELVTFGAPSVTLDEEAE